ncbi:MAG: hypothetical protein I8H76_07685 [Burkholderiales bacterium]|nr:hypothetical protein [Burkholderiales bacterium]MBH2014952.1 hypothetical protein [Burkholderiales bacterium]
MTSFVILSLALLALAASFVAWPLLSAPAAQEPPRSPPRRLTTAVLLLALAAATVALYAAVGTPAALDGQVQAAPPRGPTEAQVAAAAPAMTPQQVEGMVSRLAQRLQNQPDDVAGWRMLIRSYETLGRFEEAAQAYQRLFALEAPGADQLTEFAVTLGMSQNQTLAGEPEALINQALKLEPDHIQALALSGSAAFERQDYARAIAQWRHILRLTPPDAEVRAGIEGHIAKAQALAQQLSQPAREVRPSRAPGEKLSTQ